MSGQDEAAARWRRAFAVFERLLALDETSRAREIEALRTEDPTLWPQLRTLLRADEDAESQQFMDGSVFTRSTSSLEEGTTLGAYRLEHRLGEGGMGEVWLARRADGLFEAPVALKLLHVHLGKSAARERFVREGRILGELGHAHIARLLDAGVLPDGQLYLALEYVRGERLDRWCDTQRLDIRARVKLFLQVCEAVAHAHAHLVVHRDLKPGNILVTPDGEVKLLDFGIAKLVQDEQTETPETELTRLGGRALTPEYAAPEQIAGAPITVATDVYALGVVLYQLLSGRRPYAESATTSAEIERAVLDTEPAVMSGATAQKLPADTTVTLQDLAGLRASTPRALREALRGDLDTIVAKALKKPPAERYATVQMLAEDLRRYLDDRPILARPDSLSYRLRKYVRRHSIAVAAAAAVTVVLIAGIAGTVWQGRAAVRAERAEHAQRLQVEAREADLQQVVAFQGAMLRRADVARLAGDWMDRMRRALQDHLDHAASMPKAERERVLVDFDHIRQWSEPTDIARQSLGDALLVPAQTEIGRRFATRDTLADQLSISVADGYNALGLYQQAQTMLDPLLARRAATPDDPQRLTAQMSLVTALLGLSDAKAAVAAARDAADGRARRFGPDARETLAARSLLAYAMVEAEDFDGAESLAGEVLAVQRKQLGLDDADSLETEEILADARLGQTRYEQALEPAKRVADIRRARLGDDDPDTLKALRLEAGIFYRMGRYDETKDIESGLLDAYRRTLGENHPTTIQMQTSLAQTLIDKGETKAGAALLDAVYLKTRQVFGRDHAATTRIANNYALVLFDQGDLAGARALQEQVLAVRRRTLGPDAPATLRCSTNLLLTLAQQGHFDEARQMGERTLAAQRRVLGPEHDNTLYTWRSLAKVDLMQGHYADALRKFETMRPVQEAAFGKENEATLWLDIYIADAELQLGRRAEAEALYRSTLATLRQVLGDDAPPTTEAMHGLARALHAEKRDAEALPLAKAAYETTVQQIGADSQDAQEIKATLQTIERAIPKT